MIILIQLFYEYKNEVSHIEDRLAQIEKSYAKSIALSLWTFDKDQYNAQMQGILNIQDIIYVKIVDEDNNYLASKGYFQNNNKIVKEFVLENILHGTTIRPGKLVVEATLTRVYDDLVNMFLVIMVTQGIKTLIISFIILFLFHYYVTRYLYSIAEYTKNMSIQSNEFLKLEKDYENDELDQIVNVLNGLKKRVKKEEDKLHELNQSLDNKVKERTQKLQELMFIQNRMSSMGMMIENIAHQWRQPLASINTTVLLLDKKVSDTPIYEQIEDDLDSIESVTIYLSKTIDDIRNFYSRKKVKSKFLLSEIVDNTEKIIFALFDDKGITIHKDIQTDIELYSYPNELQQVLMSILLNAKDVLVEKNIDNPSASITIRKDDNKNSALIEICDNGGGIENDSFEKIFEAYYTTKSDMKGTGIGLYIAKMIVEQSLDGSIKAYNKPSSACFEVSLPI
jgi:signal transduction histidine kinase